MLNALTAKYSSCISNIETVLRPASTINTEPRLDLVCRRKRSHPSHYINVFAFLFFVSNKLLKCKLEDIAGINSSDGRVVKASVSGAVDLSLIPNRVKPMTLKLVFTAFLVDAQH